MMRWALQVPQIPQEMRSFLVVWADWAIGVAGLVGAFVALLALRAGNEPLVAKSLFLTIVVTGIALYASLRQRMTAAGRRAGVRIANAGDT